MRRVGCCDGIPGSQGRTRLSDDIERIGAGRRYPSEELRVAARRMGWREAGARRRLARQDFAGVK